METSRANRAEIVLVALLVAAIGWFYAWTVAPESRTGLVSAESGGYYNLLTRGFMKGRLSLDLEADPALALMKNPWNPDERGGRGLHDVSYYKGRYYIYFGVTPVVVLFLPFRLVTGRFIDEKAASLVFAWVGLLASAWLLTAIRRRYFPRAPMAALAVAVIAAGLADMMPDLLRRTSIWEVPITCAHACFMAACAALYRGLHGPRRTPWLALASAGFGLAVGARPIYLAGCLAPFVALAVAAREAGGMAAAWREPARRLEFCAALLPMAALGLGLALYNAARFGDPLQFGQRYQISGDDMSRLVFFSWRFIGYGLRLYWLEPAGWSPYFPFVLPVSLPPAPAGQFGVEDPYGILPNIPFVLLALGAVGASWNPPASGRGRLGGFCLGILAGTVGTMLSVSAFGGATNRYMVDFLPPLILLAGIGVLAVWSRPWFRGAVRAWGAAAIAALLAYSSLFNVLASLRHNELFRAEHPALYLRMAHLWNEPSHWADRWLRTEYGPIEMRLVFPQDAAGRNEPLVATGYSLCADYLFVHYVGRDAVQFGLEHTSRGVVLGETMSITPGVEHTLRIDMGSLYPPAGHPYFNALGAAQARLRSSTLAVTVDGRVALQRQAEFYDATSRIPDIGSSAGRPGYTRPFSGRILSWRRMPAATVAVPASGPLRLTFSFPAFSGPRSEPLLCTGESGRGDLLYVRYLDAGHVALGYDHWSAGGPLSGPIAVDPGAVQILEVDSGALYPEGAGAPGTAGRGPLIVRLNGRTVFNLQEPFYPCEPDEVSVGINSIHAATAAPMFSGTIARTERVAQ